MNVTKPWIDLWAVYVRGVFIRSYLKTASQSSLIPDDREDLATLMRVFLLEKAVYEIGYELNNRPDWVIIPLNGIQHILEKKI
jgi:maltose alpha-D-glucosyltransferase / alpha-amylase